MAVVTVFDPDFLVPSEIIEVLVEEPTRRVTLHDDGKFITAIGKFNYTSESALENSPVTRVFESRDQEGLDVLVDIRGLRAKLGNLQDLESLSAGNDTITGSPLDDSLSGGAGKDKVNGAAGDDFLSLDAGGDTAIGGAGADAFLIKGDSRGGKIADFDSTEGDALVLSAAELFGEGGPDFDDITSFIKITGKGSKSIVAFDADGGGDSFVKSVTVTGNLGTDVDSLIGDQILFI